MTEITLVAVGDIMLGDSAMLIGRGVNSKIKEKGVKYPFQHVVSTLRTGDITFGNLECVLSEKSEKVHSSQSLIMRGMPRSGEGLRYAGFNVLSLANNHTMEHGEEALFETMEVLSSYGIKYVGVVEDAKKDRNPIVVQIKGIKIAFLAYCLLHEDTAYCNVDNPSEIIEDVKKSRLQADVVIVSLHWGDEFIQKPSPQQVKLAREIIDAGANVILGHHPHVLQGIEKYHGGIIAYSLGNFVFDKWQKYLRESIILRISLSKERVVNVEAIPIFINENFQPEILQGNAAITLLRKLNKLSSMLTSMDLNDPDYVSKYKKEVTLHRKQFQREIRRYFIKNLFKYPFKYILSIILRSVMKRL